jgi:hypothetical protein
MMLLMGTEDMSELFTLPTAAKGCFEGGLIVNEESH